MATWRSDAYDGRYLELSVSESVDITSNTSTLYWTLTSAGGSSAYYTIAETTVTINGEQVYYKARTDYTARTFPAAKGSTSGSVTVAHDTDGSKSISVGFSTRVYVWQPVEYGGTLQLANIDRSAPSVSFSVSNINANSFKISASSSVTADKWGYSLDGGTTWTEVGYEGTYKEFNVTGLDPNATYSVQVKARKKTNNVYGYSGKASYSTLGRTTMNSVSPIAVDTDTVVVAMNATVYDSSFYHKLEIRETRLFKPTTYLTTSAFKFQSAGVADRTITLTASQRNKLLAAMSSVKSLRVRLVLTTYTTSDCTTKVGKANVKECTLTTSEAVSKPDFSDFSYVDSRGLVGKITGNAADNTILISSYSSLTVNAIAGTAKNGASIKSYSVSIGTASKTSSSTAIPVGTIGSYGDAMPLTVTCIDSRGYSTSVIKYVKVLKYEKPKLNSVTLRRKDDIEDIVQLAFRGAFSSLKPDGSTEINSVKFAGFYYKKTSEDTWSEWCSIKNDVSTAGTSFSFTADQLMKSASEALSLDTEQSYDFHLVVRDQLDAYASYDDYFVIPQGTPVVSIRKRNSTYNYARVGINTSHPTEALDVSGNVKVDGKVVAEDIVINGKTLLDWTKPIGSIYQSTDATDPSKLFGGTWEKIEGRFLLAANETYKVGSTGGEETHTLTAAEMPEHAHYMASGNGGGDGTWEPDVGNCLIDSVTTEKTTYWAQLAMNNAGGSKAHNNMPPYYAVYTWRRTA